jgi:dTDP-4-dehydrorhamnose 3,5-epimerase
MVEIIGTFSDARHFQVNTAEDPRGSFMKFFKNSVFKELGWPTEWREQYISTSHPNVIRGMHFQLPPHDHDKLVIVVSGRIKDAVVDLRRSSPHHGHHGLFTVTQGQGVFIPRGFAHGFLSTGPQDAVLLYLTTSEYQPSHDAGILWNSLGIDWPVGEAIISDRDRGFASFQEFKTPF